MLICGLPRAGKTTYSKRYECNVIHLDNYGNFGIVRDKVSKIDGDVVVEGCYTHAQQRMSLLASYKGNGKRCIWLDVPQEIREQREGWRESMGKMHFEPPTYAEGWDEIEVING